MRGYIERFQASPDQRYRAYQEALIQEGCRHFAALHNSTTPEQRQGAAVRRLRAYQQIVIELTAQQLTQGGRRPRRPQCSPLEWERPSCSAASRSRASSSERGFAACASASTSAFFR